MTMDLYEQRYKDALRRAKKLQETCDSQAVVGWCEYIFPELQESEDERIRKAILTGLIDCRDAPDLGWSDFGGINIDDCIAWLEKQSEQKTIDNDGPKFHPGDWIIDNEYSEVLKVTKADANGYEITSQDGEVFNIMKEDVECNHRLWTIKDAKDGDVLASELTGSIFLFRGIKDNKIDFYCDYDTTFEFPDDRFGINDSSEHYGSVEESQDIHPATKEQRDLLFQKMTDAGYEFVNGHITRF